MGKKKTPDIPDAPSFFEDPRFAGGVEDLLGLGGKLTSFDFSGDLSPLQDVISTSPETSALFLKNLQTQLAPQIRESRQNIVNTAVASGQEMGSGLTSQLGQLEGDLQNLFVGQTTQFGLADTQRALENRIRLFGAGTGLIGQGTGFAGSFQALKNQFNLENFENQLAVNFARQEPGKGGLSGGLTGAAGGALAGFQVGGPIGAVVGGIGGGVAGGFGPEGTGGQIFQAGTSLFGGGLGGGTSAGQAATSDPFGFQNVGFDRNQFGNLFGRGFGS